MSTRLGWEITSRDQPLLDTNRKRGRQHEDRILVVSFADQNSSFKHPHSAINIPYPLKAKSETLAPAQENLDSRNSSEPAHSRLLF